MSYRLQENETLVYGLRRIVFEEIDVALGYLDRAADDDGMDDAVHESRKSFKKVRGLLRLVRKEIGETGYKRENICFRNAGRLLSGLRDSRVMIDTLEELHKSDRDEFDSHFYHVLHENLHRSYLATRTRVLKQDALKEASEMIRAARHRVDRWPIQDDSFPAVSGGLRKVYKRGRNRLDDALDDPVAENFHEWRKRVKYLWYAIRILHPTWPTYMATLADELHELSDYLGDEHDLAELKTLLNGYSTAPHDADRYKVLSSIELIRRRLQTRAYELGQRLYTETPDAFVGRLGAYWTQANLRSAAVTPI